MRSFWVIGLVTVVLTTMVSETCGQPRRRPPLRPRPQPRCFRPKKFSQLTVKPISQERTIIGTCKVDIGACPNTPCRYYQGSYKFCPAGYLCPLFERVSVDCGTLGNFEVKKVAQCKCCPYKGIKIDGVVVDSTDHNLKLKKMAVSIYKPRVKVGLTDVNGRFKTVVMPLGEKIAINVKDPAGKYISTVKVVDIPKGFRGPVSVKIAMVKMAAPVEIDASLTNILSISSDPKDKDAGNATIVIKPGTFKSKNGKIYSGKVKASLTFINTADAGVETEIPGVFLTPNSEPLMSDGIFALSFRADDGSPLKSGPMTVMVRSGMKLWSLSRGGIWTLMPNRLNQIGRRTPRQVTLTQFNVIIDDATWVNIDKIPNAPKCYFKGRIFNEDDNTEIVSSATATFRPEIIAYRVAMSQRLRLYAGSTSSPANTCFEVRCPTDPNELLVGFINMVSYENVLISGVTVPVVETLRPKQLAQYNGAIQTAHSSVQYEVAPNLVDIFVNFISSANGPFFTSEATCLASNSNQPAFHFFKPALPSYITYPGAVQECTARVYFAGGTNFYNALNTLAGSLPTITVISVWTQSGTNYVYQSNTAMQFSNNGGDYYFACLTYRCSQPGEPTTVHIDIDIPDTTNSSGTLVPLFFCSDGKPSGGSIEGSFVATNPAGSGPDYYGSSPNDCSSRSRNEAFAHVMKCYSRFQ